MKNLNFTVFLLVAFFALAFTACDKDDDNKPLTREEMLMAKSWRLTAETTTFNNQTEDTYDDYDACEKDNFIRFLKDNKAVFDEGPTKCDPSDPQTINGTWQLAGNNLTITEDGSSFGITFNVQELTASKLVVTVSFGGASSTMTYTAQ
ncbi:lipocalin-like domain-containing protein [Botryobacter ruber]|uniref:lipocalin family protein n=1 Tax=Botryobacter ruber TaxID=2171629 RepID=UPI000E0C2BE0|nr:lipocalin family protein [Botryobacter ruber]